MHSSNISRRHKELKFKLLPAAAAILVTAVSAFGFQSIVGPLPGNLDPTFHSDGIVTTYIGGQYYNLGKIAVQPDGRLVAVGTYYPDSFSSALVVRYLADGTLDPTFGTGGVLTFRWGQETTGNDVTIQPDGKIIFVGGARNTYNEQHFLTVRLNADGTPDTSFSGDGIAPVQIYGGDGIALLVQPDGKIVISGRSTGPAGEQFTLLRLNANGAVDTAFGTSGWAKTYWGTMDWALDVVRQDDGKLVAIGACTINWVMNFAVARFNSTGTLDTSFGTDGKVKTMVGVGPNGGRAGFVQPDGKIVVVGNSNSADNLREYTGIARYNSNGTPDATFDGDGQYVTTVRSVSYDTVLQKDGRIVTAGHVYNSLTTRNDLAVFRFNPNGSPDNSFGTGGYITTPIGDSSLATAAALQKDGKIVLGGSSSVGEARSYAIARYFAVSSNVADLDGDGTSDIAVFRPASGEWWYLPSLGGAPLVFNYGNSSDVPAAADYDGDGKTDVAVWRSGALGYAYIHLSSDGTDRTEQFGQAGDVLAIGDWDGDGKADLATYRDSAVGSQSYFYYRGTFNNPAGDVTYIPWGTAGDIAMRGDFDGDKRMDAAVFRPSDATWYILRSSDGTMMAEKWGLATDKFVPADYDADGRTDLAVFRDGTWYIRQSSNGQAKYVPFGIAADQPVPADYDGDYRTEIAVYRGGIWYIMRSDGTVTIREFGTAADVPVIRGYLP